MKQFLHIWILLILILVPLKANGADGVTPNLGLTLPEIVRPERDVFGVKTNNNWSTVDGAVGTAQDDIDALQSEQTTQNTNITDLQNARAGWINSADYTDINSAIAACTNTTLVIGEAETLTAHAALPAGCELQFFAGGSITLGDFNLSIQESPVLAGDHQIFIYTGTGVVSGLTVINAKWFGAVGNDVTDDTVNIQRAIDVLTNGDRFIFPRGIYKITDQLLFGDLAGIDVAGAGEHTYGTLINWKGVSSPTKAAVKLWRVEHSKFHDFVIGSAAIATSSGYGLYITSEGTTGTYSAVTAFNQFEYITVSGFQLAGIHLGNAELEDVNVDHNSFYKVQSRSNTGAAGMIITNTNTNNTSIRDCTFEGNKYNIQLATSDTGLSGPRDIIIDNVGLGSVETAHIMIYSRFNSVLEIKNLQLELGNGGNGSFLETAAAVGGWYPDIRIENVHTTYNTWEGLDRDIIKMYHGGTVTMKNCQFAGKADGTSGNSRIIWEPTGSQEAGLRLLTTEGVYLYNGAAFAVRTASHTISNPVHWLDKGSNYSTTGAIMPVSNPKFKLHNIDQYQSLTSGVAPGFSPFPVLTGVTVANEELGLSQIATFKVTIDKTAWTVAAPTQSLDFLTFPPMTRIKSIVADTTADYTLGANTLVLKITNTIGNEFIANHDVTTGTPTQDVDQGGFISSYVANGQIRATLTSGTDDLGTGATTSLTTGSTDIYITLERLK